MSNKYPYITHLQFCIAKACNFEQILTHPKNLRFWASDPKKSMMIHFTFILKQLDAILRNHYVWLGMILGGAGATVMYNLRLRHPTLELPIIDYDLALLFQPMLMLGISIGVSFNVLFPDWIITVLLIVFFLGKQTLPSFPTIHYFSHLKTS